MTFYLIWRLICVSVKSNFDDVMIWKYFCHYCGFPSNWPGMRNFDVFFLWAWKSCWTNKELSCSWRQTPWHYCNVVLMWNCPWLVGVTSLYLDRVLTVWVRVPFQYPTIDLLVRSREISKPRDYQFKLLYSFATWQAPQQHCCRDAWQISERLGSSKHKFPDFWK